MATDVKALLLQFDANVEGARREMVRLAQEVETQSGRIEKSGGKAGAAMDLLKGSIGGMLAGLSVGAVVSFSRAMLEFADDLSTAADQAGIGVERFQTLREGLRSLEIGAEQQQKVFERLLTTLGAVQGGTAGKGTIEVLDRMGITARIVNGEIDQTDELLDAIAQAAGRYNTVAEFTADVSELVGQKIGPKLAAALKDGGTALAEAEGNFRATGSVIDEELIQQLARANESIDSFTTKTQNKMVIWTGAMIKGLEIVGQKWRDIFGQDLTERSGIEKALADARFTLLEKRTGQGFHPFATYVYENQLRNAENAMDRLEARGEYNKSASVDPMTRLFPMGGGTWRTPAAASRAPARAGGRSAKASGPAAKSWLQGVRDGDFDSPMAPAGIFAELPVARVNIEAMLADLEKMGQLPPIDAIDSDDLALAQDYTRTLTEGLVQAAIYGRSFTDVLKGIGQQILAGGLLNIISGGTLGTSFGAALGGIGKIFGGFRENGGPVMPGRAYVVGEKRPELFVPSTAGTIIPRLPTGQQGGGQQEVSVRVEPSPFFIATVAQGAQAAAQDTIRRGTRARMPMSAGA